MKYIILDLDGTIASSGERSIFFSTNPRNYPAAEAGVIHDEIIEPIHDLVSLMSKNGYEIIVMSARAETSMVNTKKWLDAKNIPYTDVYMKAENDFRKDYIVKQVMLRKIIKKYGHPFMAIEDRPDVVDMFRKEGVFSLTVNNVARIAAEDMDKENVG